MGRPIDSQNIINRHFRPLLRHAGLLDIRWHDLWHTCVTLLLSRGSHPKLVQHLLSHSSIQLTLDRYSHWMPSMGRSTADGMDEALGLATYSGPSLPLGAVWGRSHSET
jgi:integrase